MPHATGDFITNSTTNKRTRVPRLVRIHSDELEDIPSAVRTGVTVCLGGGCLGEEVCGGGCLAFGCLWPVSLERPAQLPPPCFASPTHPHSPALPPHHHQSVTRPLNLNPPFKPHTTNWSHTLLTPFSLPHAPLTTSPTQTQTRTQNQSAGDIVALFGIECASGDTFTDGSVNLAMTSIKVRV